MGPIEEVEKRQVGSRGLSHPWQTSVHQVPSLSQPQRMLLSNMGYPLTNSGQSERLGNVAPNLKADAVGAAKPQCTLRGGVGLCRGGPRPKGQEPEHGRTGVVQQKNGCPMGKETLLGCMLPVA
jgi:hypothetical protein